VERSVILRYNWLSRMDTDGYDVPRNWKAMVSKVFSLSNVPGHPLRVPSTGTTSGISRLTWSLIRVCFIPETAPLETNTDIFGSKVVLMVCYLIRSAALRMKSYWFVDVINVSGHRLSTAEIESALIMHKGVAETAGMFICLFLTWDPIYNWIRSHRYCGRIDRPSRLCFRHSQTVSLELFVIFHAFWTCLDAAVNLLMIPTMKLVSAKNSSSKFVKWSGPSQRPRRSLSSATCPRLGLERYIVSPRRIYLPAYSLHHQQIMRRIMRKIVDGEGDQLGDLSTVAEPGIVDVIKKKVAESKWFMDLYGIVFVPPGVFQRTSVVYY